MHELTCFCEKDGIYSVITFVMFKSIEFKTVDHACDFPNFHPWL
jgi:hypothetical protein